MAVVLVYRARPAFPEAEAWALLSLVHARLPRTPACLPPGARSARAYGPREGAADTVRPQSTLVYTLMLFPHVIYLHTVLSQPAASKPATLNAPPGNHHVRLNDSRLWQVPKDGLQPECSVLSTTSP